MIFPEGVTGARGMTTCTFILCMPRNVNQLSIWWNTLLGHAGAWAPEAY